MRRFVLVYMLLVLHGSLTVLSAGAQQGVHVLMPAPLQLAAGGQRLPINGRFTISVTGHPDPRLYAEASRFVRRLSERTGIFMDRIGYVRPADSTDGATLLIRVRRPGKLELQEDESYRLEIDAMHVHLEAETDLGAIHGLETLFQLVSADTGGYYFPGVSITDRPRFAWRGLLLDVALHFQPVEEIKRTLDGMAAVKMNVLHLHCCNDQGFRVESKVFPRLQQVASDGQFYTQEEIWEIVRYAAQRGIRVVPEFVVPAHTTAILTAYPGLASVKRAYTLQRYFGVFDPVLDPTNDSVYLFLDKLFTEMAALFPDAYFHIGGDENTGKDWQRTPHIRAFMRSHGMKEYMDLQTYFNRRVEPILRRNGKNMMGWDEILQHGVPKDIVIQSWRGNAAFYESVKKGYRAILSYGYYIDLIQPASYHYGNDPIPDSVTLTAEESGRILGGEATMWGELITPETVDSRIWPRTAAIAERLWSPGTVRDTDDMYRRLDVVNLELEGLGLRQETNRAAMMRRLANGWDTKALETLVDVLEPLKIYDRNQGDTMYTVFSPLTKLADVAIPDQRLPRLFNRWVDEFLGGDAGPAPENKIAAENKITAQLEIWKENDVAFRLLLARSPVLEEAAPLSKSLSELAAAGLEAMHDIHEKQAAGNDWLRRQLEVVQQAAQQSGRCELQVVTAIRRLIDRAAAAGGGQAVYGDSVYRQDYSIKYERLRVEDPASLRLSKVVCDRNGVIQILSSQGLLRPSGGAFLYPGELAPDKTYRMLPGRSIKDVTVYERQFVYADDKAVLSNAWAGKLYVAHTMPGVTMLAGGSDFSFLLSDGRSLQYRKDSMMLWQGSAEDTVVDLRWNRRNNAFWVLGRHSLSLFSPADRQWRVVYRGNDLTCMEPIENSEQVLVGTHDGYLLVNGSSGLPIGDINRRLPCTDIRVIRRVGGRTWFGSSRGAFVLREDGGFDYFASRRWLPSDGVTDIAGGPDGTVLVLTDKGLGEIHFDPMTLYDKAMYFEKQVRDRHIRLGFNSALERLKDGDLSTGSVEDSDNDGLWTSMYLGAEAFRYAATHSPEALQNCRESLDAMERLYTINSLKGFPSRSFERRGYAAADTQVWKRAASSEWDWKSTTSSDEAIGHVFVLGVIAEIVDDTAIQHKAVRLLDALMSHIVEHDLYLIDWNGKPTLWGRWNPEYVNAQPKNVGDRKLNSSNIIAMLQTAWHFTGKAIYRDKALELMNKYGYLENLIRPISEIGHAPEDANPLSKKLSDAWNHSDDEMYFLGYWGLYRYALNDTLREKFKAAILDHWEAERPEKEGAWDIFTAMTGTPDFDLGAAAWYLQRSPLDMIDWSVSNSRRGDIVPIAANFREQSIAEVLPPDELPVNRHNSNRFQLDGNGNGHTEHSAGDIWLLPYWMGRYLGVIGAPTEAGAGAGLGLDPEEKAGGEKAVSSEQRYVQDYSIKYRPATQASAGGWMPASAGAFHAVVSDRNGVVQVLADSGVLRPYSGRLLYPGALLRDRVYRVLTDRKISGLCLSEGQVVYLDDEALFSNAWAGRLYVRHGMPGAHLVAAGAGRSFLISDGHRLLLAGDSIMWSGVSTVAVLAIRYEPSQNLFWLLSGGAVACFSPVTKKIVPVFSGAGLTCLAFWNNKVVIGSHNGYIELGLASRRPLGAWHRSLPCADLTVMEVMNGQLWFGSAAGAFVPGADGHFSYYASERWLPGDHVVSMGQGPDSAVLVMTDKGLGKICFEWMSLEQKAAFYEKIVRQRHIRYGFYSDYSGTKEGDVSTAEMRPHDSDNLWTSMYLVGEMFRYLVTHDAGAKENYYESFDAMERLFTLSGIPGLFGRCIERRGLEEFKEEYRQNIETYWYPGYARTPSSWHHSPDSAWDWRGSSSSDQAVGQFFSLTLVAQYTDDPQLKERAVGLIDQLAGYILDNGLRLIDVDGRPTLWGLWGPEYVNRFPDMVGDKKLYSSNIISFLQTAWHFTGKEKYKDKAMELLYRYHYLQNLTRPVRGIGQAPDTADAWSKELSGGWNNSDDEMYFLAYWGLFPYALDKTLQTQFGEAIRDHWDYKRSAKDGLWDLCYGAITGASVFDLDSAIWELRRMPLDLINWNISNSGRKDIVFLPLNSLEQYTREVLPPDERPENKHNRNFFRLDDKGNGGGELGGGDVFLLPYWMGRYFGAIGAATDHKQ